MGSGSTAGDNKNGVKWRERFVRRHRGAQPFVTYERAPTGHAEHVCR